MFPVFAFAARHDEEALKIIAEGKGTNFDPVLTDLFLDVLKAQQGLRDNE